MLQDDYRKLYKRINKNWNDSVSIYKKLVQENITKDSVVVDAGCGFSDMFHKEYRKAKKVIGIDVSEEFISNNKYLDERLVSDLSSIPQVADDSIDLIISSWVFEHLEYPDKVFSEFRRILKKGGKVIFLTPNICNYVVFLNRIIPDWLRNKVIGQMSEHLVTDPMKVYYRANSIRRLRNLAKRNSFTFESLILNGDPTYIAINKVFFYISILIETFLGIPLLKQTRVHIIGVLRKI